MALRLRCKVLLIGDPAVGKTAISQTFSHGLHHFRKDYAMTTGVDVYMKPIKIPEQPVCVELFVLDAGGDDYTQELLKPHYATANAFVFVYDVTSLDSFHHLRSWYERVQAARENAAVVGVVLANKSDYDTSGHNMVKPHMGQEFAKARGLEFFDTSALRGEVEVPLCFLAEVFASSYEERRLALLEM
ncbi:unnamed protein product [Vitrella brassicaformis CCMP3155]|uniref:Uncharacterized protein n=2 Tax=Vitrella brassicaformis TaxID=1169539 RepID=A0A0G4EFJ8_VITBC|nr:unnamed protein product [Vitrella brassicaformis CCMP3155]|eukprot:CEL94148.1 unnamed protein product [Vitrella brassicaformis CCMP3155]